MWEGLPELPQNDRHLSKVDFHGNAANPSLNGTLRHSDINLVISQYTCACAGSAAREGVASTLMPPWRSVVVGGGGQHRERAGAQDSLFHG